MCETCDKKSVRKPRKRKSLKRKTNECPDNERKKEEPPKCPKPKRQSLKAKKCLTRIEEIMLRIQPPIADRERYLHPYHVNCFLEESERVPIKKPICGPCPSKRKKICGEGTKKKSPDDAAKDGTENVKENDATSDSTKLKSEENPKGEGEKEIIEDTKEAEETRDNKNRKKKKKKKREMKTQEADNKGGSDSETSIHSNDSEVCLAGLRLSKADKEQIEKNHNSTRTPQENGNNGAQSTEGVQEATTEESKDTE